LPLFESTTYSGLIWGLFLVDCEFLSLLFLIFMSEYHLTLFILLIQLLLALHSTLWYFSAVWKMWIHSLIAYCIYTQNSITLNRDPSSPPDNQLLTPERDQTAEHIWSWQVRLNMTGTDEWQNSRSRSGTPHPQGGAVSQPIFEPVIPVLQGQLAAGSDVLVRNQIAPIPIESPHDRGHGRGHGRRHQGNAPVPEDDPFQMNVDPPINIAPLPLPVNADVLPAPNEQLHAVGQMPVGPLSQEGRVLQWQLSQVANQQVAPAMGQVAVQPARVVAGARRRNNAQPIIGHASRDVHPNFPGLD
jgi:hypothetical protein